jgi:hypothetical protein
LLLKDRLLRQLKEYWQAKVVLVTITKPYFRAIDPRSLIEEDYSFVPLENDADFEVSGEALKEFTVLVKKFLMNGKTAPHDRLANFQLRYHIDRLSDSV